MKFSFMSFSGPNLNLEAMLETAERYGYAGIEPRIASKHRHGLELDVSERVRCDARQKADAAGVTIFCIATSCRFADPTCAESHVREAVLAIDLAADLGGTRLRVFGGALGEGVQRAEAVDQVAGCLGRLADQADRRNVVVCVETHDDWCCGQLHSTRKSNGVAVDLYRVMVELRHLVANDRPVRSDQLEPHRVEMDIADLGHERVARFCSSHVNGPGDGIAGARFQTAAIDLEILQATHFVVAGVKGLEQDRLARVDLDDGLDGLVEVGMNVFFGKCGASSSSDTPVKWRGSGLGSAVLTAVAANGAPLGYPVSARGCAFAWCDPTMVATRMASLKPELQQDKVVVGGYHRRVARAPRADLFPGQ